MHASGVEESLSQVLLEWLTTPFKWALWLLLGQSYTTPTKDLFKHLRAEEKEFNKGLLEMYNSILPLRRDDVY